MSESKEMPSSTSYNFTPEQIALFNTWLARQQARDAAVKSREQQQAKAALIQGDAMRRTWQKIFGPDMKLPEDKNELEKELMNKLRAINAAKKRYPLYDISATLMLLYASSFGLGYFLPQWWLVGPGWSVLYSVVFAIMVIGCISILVWGDYGMADPAQVTQKTIVSVGIAISVIVSIISGGYYAYAYYSVNGGNLDNLSDADCQKVTDMLDAAKLCTFICMGCIVPIIFILTILYLRSASPREWEDTYSALDAQYQEGALKNFARFYLKEELDV
jgi:hypothetical protein